MKLRLKFIATILLINLVTAGIIFWSLSLLQTREQTARIEAQSMVYSQFSTERVVRTFMDSFQKAYFEKFLPEIKEVVEANEDLLKLRVISVRSGAVLFDSRLAFEGKSGPALTGLEKADFPPEFSMSLASSDVASRSYLEDGQKRFSVVTTFRSPQQEPLFRVEYQYDYRSLFRSLEAIRARILRDLLPALAFGMLIALVFAQLLISPIRKLVAALGRVQAGDFGVTVAASSRDEIGELVGAFNSMTDELRRKKELRKYLSNFSYQAIVKAADMAEGDVPRIGGSRVKATILFCDIRDFVAHCESLEAEEVTSMLNEYFSEMVAVIHKNGGEVDKFIGDAILAVFYPEEGKASEAATSLQAIYCALEMRARLAVFNERRASSGKRRLEIGIGLSFGEIIVGPIGAENRMDFTVIGDVVNLANRIEKLSKQGRHTRVLFSHQVEEQIRGLLRYEEISAAAIRGKQEEVHVFELIGIKDLEILVGNLRSTDVSLRRRSVELLGQSGNSDALVPVLESLNDTDEQVRILASIAIGRLAQRNEDRALDALFQRVRREDSSKVASAMIACIGKICRNERVLELEFFLSSSDERVVANAIEAVGQARTPLGTDLILPKLDSRNNRIKANAAMAVFAAGRTEVIDILKPMLMHSDPLMRSSAAFAIGELTLIADLNGLLPALRDEPSEGRQMLAELQECVPMLVALLKDPEAVVKRQAVIALGKIRDKSAVLPLIGLLESPEILPDVLESLRTIGSHKLVRDLLTKLS